MFIYSLNIYFFENEMFFFADCMNYTLSLVMFTSLQVLLQISCSRYSAELSTMALSLCRIFFFIHSIQSIAITSPQQPCTRFLNFCHSFKKEHLHCKTIQERLLKDQRKTAWCQSRETLTWRSLVGNCCQPNDFTDKLPLKNTDSCLDLTQIIFLSQSQRTRFTSQTQQLWNLRTMI